MHHGIGLILTRAVPLRLLPGAFPLWECSTFFDLPEFHMLSPFHRYKIDSLALAGAGASVSATPSGASPLTPSPPTMAPSATWSVDFDTRKREQLFRNPPSDTSAYPSLQETIKPHVDSFNYVFAENGQLHHGLQDIGTRTFLDGNGQEDGVQRNRLQLRVQNVFLDESSLPPLNKTETNNRKILPVECRERHVTYRGRFRGRLQYRVNDGEWKESLREYGHLPIMLRSNKCHLKGLSPKQLADAREETEELGGYFIVNGIEKLVRMLIVNRRNFPMAITRPSFESRGATYTKYGVQIRSVRQDQTSQTNVLHYLSDGNVTFRFSWRKNEYLVPVMMILKALVETNDREIFEGIVGPAGGMLRSTSSSPMQPAAVHIPWRFNSHDSRSTELPKD